MTDEKWMTFDELPNGLCTYRSFFDDSTHIRIKRYGRVFEVDASECIVIEGKRYRPIDPKAIEVGELFLMWVEWHRERDPLTPEVHIYDSGVINFLPVLQGEQVKDTADAFRDFFERMKPKEPETTVKDIPPMKFGANPTGLFFRTIRGGLEFTSDLSGGKGWILSNQDSDNPPCTIHNTLEEATDAAKEARQ